MNPDLRDAGSISRLVTEEIDGPMGIMFRQPLHPYPFYSLITTLTPNLLQRKSNDFLSSPRLRSHSQKNPLFPIGVESYKFGLERDTHSTSR